MEETSHILIQVEIIYSIMAIFVPIIYRKEWLINYTILMGISCRVSIRRNLFLIKINRISL